MNFRLLFPLVLLTIASVSGQQINNYLNHDWTIGLGCYHDTIWIAGTVALLKMDKHGNRIATYRYPAPNGFSNGTSSTLTIDADGKIWMSGWNAVHVFDGKNWSKFDPMGTEEYLRGTLSSDRIGRIWFRSSAGIAVYEQNKWKKLLSESGPIAFDANNDLWVGSGRGVKHFHDNTWITYAMPEGFGTDLAMDIVFDKENRGWLATNKGIYMFDGATWKSWDTSNGLVDDYVTCCTIDKSGAIWFGTHNGVHRWNGSSFDSYTSPDVLPDLSINTITADSIGNVYFYSGRENFSRFNGSTWTIFDSTNWPELVPIEAFVIGCDGTVLIAHNGYISNFNNDSITTHPIPNDLRSNEVNALVLDTTRRLWIGTSEGFSSEPKQGWTEIEPNLPNRRILSGITGRSGEPIFGTWTGIVRIDPSSKTATTYDNSYRVEALTIDDSGKIWTANTKLSYIGDLPFTIMFSYGISSFDGNTWTNYTTVTGSTDRLYAICAREYPTLWLGTDRGVLTFDRETGTAGEYVKEAGTAPVCAMAKDKTGRVWMSTDSGIVSFDGNSWKKHPLPTGPSPVNTIVVDNAQNVWAASGKTVYKITQGVLSTAFTLDSINDHITSLAIDSEEVVWAGTSASGLFCRVPNGVTGMRVTKSVFAGRNHTITACGDRMVVNLRDPVTAPVSLKIFDMKGRLLFSTVQIAAQGRLSVHVPKHLASGCRIVSCTSHGISASVQVIY